MMIDVNAAIELLEKWPEKQFQARTHDLCVTGAMLSQPRESRDSCVGWPRQLWVGFLFSEEVTLGSSMWIP